MIPLLRRPGLYVFAVGLAYAVLAFALSNAPLQDLPNHLTRAHIISDLWFNQGAVYGGTFMIKPALSPYLVGDLLLSCLDKLFGTAWACRIWIAAAILLMPLSALFVLSGQKVSRMAALTGALLALYVATDWFFVMGFLTYQLAISCALFAYGWFLRARQTSRPLPYVAFVVFVCLAYAMHLSALVFLIALVGTSLVVGIVAREDSILSGAVLLAPPCLVLAAHLAFSRDSSYSGYSTIWATWDTKLVRLVSPVVRFGHLPELALFGLYLVAALFPLAWLKEGRSFAVAKQLLLAAVFVGLYFLLPQVLHNMYDIDNRALPYALLFVFFAGVIASEASAAVSRAQFLVVAVLACSNLAYVFAQMLPQEEAMGRYKLIAGAIPAGAAVLPIDTRGKLGRFQPFLHAGSYATLESAAVTPYLFAANKDASQPYFFYRELPYSPLVFWYTQTDVEFTGLPNWPLIKKEYRYLLVTLPWDPLRIPLPYRVVESNETAALLDIQI